MAVLPRISIVVKGKGGEQGVASLPSLGLALHAAWIFVAIFCGVEFALDSTALRSFKPLLQPLPLGFAAAAATQAIALLAAGIIPKRKPAFLRSPSFATACALAMAAGSGASALFADDAMSSVVTIASGVVIGAGSAGLLLFWAESYSRLGIASLTLNTAIAIPLSAIIVFCTVHLAPAGFVGGVATALPLLEIPVAHIASRTGKAGDAVASVEDAGIKTGKYGSMLGLAMILMGLSLGMLEAMVSEMQREDFDLASQAAALLIGCLGILLLFHFAMDRDEEEVRWDLLLRPLMIIVGLAAFLTPLLFGAFPPLANLVLFTCYLCTSAALWVSLVGAARECGISSTFSIGVGCGMLTLGTLLGAWIAFDPHLLASMQWEFIAAAILLSFAIGYVIYPRVDIVKRDARRDNPPDTETPIEESARTALQAETDAYRLACETIGAENGLSQRQIEVLYLLSRGHNAAFIRDRLGISLSTAKSHIYRLYKKLGIHTQHELLELVESRLRAWGDAGFPSA